MKKHAEIVNNNAEQYEEFRKLPADQQTDETFPYNRHLDLEEMSNRYDAILGSDLADQKQFVQQTYKFSIKRSIRPQDKNKKEQDESSPEEVDMATLELCKKNRDEWLRFLKGIFSNCTN